MTAVLKREFKSYFTGMTGYVIIAVLCFFFGLFYTSYNVSYGYPHYGIALYRVQTYLMIIIPILTMKCFSEERKNRSDQLLLTSPVSVSGIAVGKFLGMVGVFAVPVLFSCIFPLFIAGKAEHNLLIDYSCILAFFLLGCVYISIGMFISSLTESQIIAAVVSFIIFLGFFIMPTLVAFIPDASYVNAIGFNVLALLLALIVRAVTKNSYAAVGCFILLSCAVWIAFLIDGSLYYGLLAKVLTVISFADGISYFANGIFDVAAIVRFISVICLFVYLTVQSVNRRRWN